ncbi:MAG: PaaI family thioesterase [Chloroflexota bacterium]
MTGTDAISNAWKFLGLELVEAGDGKSVVEMTTGEQLTNRQGTVHGGFIATLCDSAMARAITTRLAPGTRAFSFDLKVNFINLARPGDRLRASGRVIHAGRRTAVAECRVEGPGRRLVATSTASFSISPEGDER